MATMKKTKTMTSNTHDMWVAVDKGADPFMAIGDGEYFGYPTLEELKACTDLGDDQDAEHKLDVYEMKATKKYTVTTNVTIWDKC